MSAALIVAEPETATRGFLERHLANDGFEVLGAKAAAEALDLDRKSTRLNSSHIQKSRMPSSA